MYIHDDAPMAEVVEQTVSTLKEAARHVGKADSTITEAQVREIKEAIADLEGRLQFKGAAKG